MTLQTFVPLWNARQGGDRRNDLISLLANGPATALDRRPGEMARLRANPALLESAAPEIIRWQSPVA